MPVVTTAQAAQYLNLSLAEDQQPAFAAVVSAACAAVERYCRRHFDAKQYTEYHDIRGVVSSLWVDNPPIITLTSLTDDANTDTVTNRSNRAIDITANIEKYPAEDPDRVRLTNSEGVFASGLKAAKIVYTGGYPQNEMPAELVFAACQLVAAWWEGPEALTRRQQILGGDVIMWRDSNLPPQVVEALAPFRRVVI